MTAYSVRCLGATVCVIEGVATTSSRGRYRLDGGVLTLLPRRCQYRFYDKNIQLKNTGSCPEDTQPITLRMVRGPQGRLRFSGLGSSPVDADEQALFGATKIEGPPANWDVVP